MSKRKPKTALMGKKIEIKTYSWKPAASRFRDVDPQEAGEALDKLRSMHGGDLQPADVVEAASDESHPLHPVFPWDDEEAARIGRECIAREIIRSIRVRIITPERKEIDTRAFVSVPDPKQPGKRVYHAVAHTLESPEGRALLLRQAWLELQAWRHKYNELNELAQVFDAMDAAANILKRAG